MDSNLAIAVTGGSVSIATIVVSFVVWSLKRNVQHEDEAKVETKAELDDHDKRLQETKHTYTRELQEIRDMYTRELQAVRSEMMTTGHKAELGAHDARTQLAALVGAFGELKGTLRALHESFEEGREKQAQFYRNELAKTETFFRQELTRSISPDFSERLMKLEARLDSLPSRPKRKS